MPVVSDASPLILHAKIERLNLLKELYSEVIIPSQVRDEVLKQRNKSSSLLVLEMVTEVMKEFGEDHGVIYVDKAEDALEKVVELIESGSVEEHGSRGRKFVEKYNWDDIVDDFEGVLVEVVRNK